MCQQFQNLLLTRTERINEGLILSGRGRAALFLRALLLLQKRFEQVIDIGSWMMLAAAFQKRHEAGTFIEKVTQIAFRFPYRQGLFQRLQRLLFLPSMLEDALVGLNTMLQV